MTHDTPLLTLLAAAFAAAWVLGLAARKLNLSPIVGYLLAGVVIGPYTPGFVGDVGLASQLAEVGVVLLMFGVGLHFHLRDLLEVKGIALPGALIQSGVATLLGLGLGLAEGWPVSQGLVLGMALSVASTVVLLRGLEEHDLVSTPAGHAAIGWLIVEDILTVVVLVIIPALGGGASGGLATSLAISLAKLAALVALVFLAGSRVLPWVLTQVARLRSRELFTLTVLALAVAIAVGAAYAFGASMALGAFLAGMVVGQTTMSHQAAADALPLRDAFAVLFFVSVGMLLDPSFLVREPLLLAAALAIVLVGKPLAALAVTALLGYSTRTGLVVALGLAQVGEFSFILGALAREHGLLGQTGSSLLVACALVSISLNPFLFRWLDAIEGRLRAHPRLWRLLDARSARKREAINARTAAAIAANPQPLAVIVGYGPVGQAVDRALRRAGTDTVVVDLNMDTVAELEAKRQRALFGDASQPGLLEQAGIARARHLVVTLPHSVNRAPLIATARELAPACRIVVRARYLRESADLVHFGANAACFEEAEAAAALTELVLLELGLGREAASAEGDRVRQEAVGRFALETNAPPA
jgi:CPA2 family monovalent cation:H+ antiporter-2